MFDNLLCMRSFSFFVILDLRLVIRQLLLGRLIPQVCCIPFARLSVRSLSQQRPLGDLILLLFDCSFPSKQP